MFDRGNVPRRLCGHAADRFKHMSARLRLSKVSRATRGFGLGTGGRIIVRGDEDERGMGTITNQTLSQLDAGYATELDVQHEAVELRVFLIREKCFGRRIGDRLNAGRAQQPAKGLAKPFVIIDDGDVSLFGADHCEAMGIVEAVAK